MHCNAIFVLYDYNSKCTEIGYVLRCGDFIAAVLINWPLSLFG